MVVWQMPCESSTPPGSQYKRTPLSERGFLYLDSVGLLRVESSSEIGLSKSQPFGFMLYGILSVYYASSVCLGNTQFCLADNELPKVILIAITTPSGDHCAVCKPRVNASRLLRQLPNVDHIVISNADHPVSSNDTTSPSRRAKLRSMHEQIQQ